jgi:hypothetical protein
VRKEEGFRRGKENGQIEMMGGGRRNVSFGQ